MMAPPSRKGRYRSLSVTMLAVARCYRAQRSEPASARYRPGCSLPITRAEGTRSGT